MITESEAALEQLLIALEQDREDCWALYEEVGRVVMAHLGTTDRSAFTTIAKAWIVSAAAQGRLADTWPDVRDFGEIEKAADAADSRLFETVRWSVFGK